MSGALQWRGVPRPSPDRFRIVLCWLENDYNGENAANAEAAFSGVNGITLVRSRETVSASGAGDEWRETIQEKARAVLEREKADVAIVGKVKSRKRVARVMREAGLARVIHRPLTPQILVLPKW